MVLCYVSPSKPVPLGPRAILWRKEQLCTALSTNTPSNCRMAALAGKGDYYLTLWGSTKGSLKRVLCKPLETSIYSASTLGHSQRIQERRGDAMDYLIAVSCSVMLSAFSQNKNGRKMESDVKKGRKFS